MSTDTYTQIGYMAEVRALDGADPDFDEVNYDLHDAGFGEVLSLEHYDSVVDDRSVTLLVDVESLTDDIDMAGGQTLNLSNINRTAEVSVYMERSDTRAQIIDILAKHGLGLVDQYMVLKVAAYDA